MEKKSTKSVHPSQNNSFCSELSIILRLSQKQAVPNSLMLMLMIELVAAHLEQAVIPYCCPSI
jgi:hypothetical protein